MAPPREPISVVVPRLPHLADSKLQASGLELAELYDRFLTQALGHRSPKTLANHRRSAVLLRTMPAHPTPGDVSTWLAALRAGGFGERTIAMHRWNLGAVYSWGNACALVAGNPAELCPYTAPKPAPKAIRAIRKEWPRLAACASDARELAFLATLRFEGLRLGEALGLWREDVHLDRGQMEVARQRAPNSWAVRFPKSERGHRCLPIRRELVPILRRVLSRPCVVAKGRGGSAGRMEVPWLFPYRQQDLEAIRARLAAAMPDAFGPGDAWHVFRHSFAVEARAKGVPVEDLADWLGHASPTTTMIYLASLAGTAVSKAAAAQLDGRKAGPALQVRRKLRGKFES